MVIRYRTGTHVSDEGWTNCNNYTAVCPPVRGENPRALASGFSPVQADNP